MKRLILYIGVSMLFLIGCSKTVKTEKIEKIIPFEQGNSASAADLIKDNVVKITNVTTGGVIVGTGFFHESGYLITNSHNVDIEGKISVDFPDGSNKDAILVSNDLLSDVAILSVDNPTVKAMYFGETISLRLTNSIYSIGYAYNIEGSATITAGVLSAKRSSGGIEYLQTDAQMNPGCSGGPVINDKGELLGMASLASDNASIGMSISAESLSTAIEKLINDNKVVYLTDERPVNALSSVLSEIGYNKDHIYPNDKYIVNTQGTDAGNDSKDDGTSSNGGSETGGSKSNSGTGSTKTIPIKSFTINNVTIPKSDYLGGHILALPGGITSVDVKIELTDKSYTYEVTGNTGLKIGQNIIGLVVKDSKGAKVFECMYWIQIDKINTTFYSYPMPIKKIESYVHIMYDNASKQSVLAISNEFYTIDGVSLHNYEFGDPKEYGEITIDLYESVVVKMTVDTPENTTRLFYTKTIPGSTLKHVLFDGNDYIMIPLSEIKNSLTDKDIGIDATHYSGIVEIEYKLRENKGTYISKTSFSIEK